jgi:hypothetical protein
VGKGLLAETVFPHLHRHHGGSGVRVVRHADRDGVNALVHLGEHFTIVVVYLGLRVAFLGSGEGVVINVADRHNIPEAGGISGITLAFPSDSNTGEGNTPICG